MTIAKGLCHSQMQQCPTENLIGLKKQKPRGALQVNQYVWKIWETWEAGASLHLQGVVMGTLQTPKGECILENQNGWEALEGQSWSV